MNILSASDTNYLAQTEVMLYSLRTNTSGPIDFYFLHSSIPEHVLSEFQERVDKMDINYHDLLVDEKIFHGYAFHDLGHITIATYFRFLAIEMLPYDVDRILWLDSDIIINKSIDSLYNYDFNDNLLVACEDYWVSVVRGMDTLFQVADIPMSQNKYFNAGVILFNIEELKKTYSINQVTDVLKKYKNEIRANDQDILNYLYGNRTLYADAEKFNFQPTICRGTLDYDVVLNNACIIHFIGGGRCKPWATKYSQDKLNLVWWKYAKETSSYKNLYRRNYFRIHCSYFLSKIKSFISGK